MYKININDSTLCLVSSEKAKKLKREDYSLISPYSGKTKMLLSYIDLMEKTNRLSKIALYAPDVKKLKQDFESLFRMVEASGGVVEDENGKVLMIFRRGHWDLPKGKIDMGEGKKEAAIREVEEETGVKGLSLGKKIITTRHTYKIRGTVRAIKKTYWYLMYAKNQKLVPQTEEDIEKAKWVNPRKVLSKELPIYSNILDVLAATQHISEQHLP